MILKYCHLLPNMIYSIHYSYISSTTFLIIDAKKWTYSHTSEHWKFHDCSAPLRCAIAWVWSLGPHLPGRPGPKALLLPGMASAKLGKAMEVWDCLRTSAAFGSDFTNNIKEFKNTPQYSRIFQNVSECFRMFQTFASALFTLPRPPCVWIQIRQASALPRQAKKWASNRTSEKVT